MCVYKKIKRLHIFFKIMYVDDVIIVCYSLSVPAENVFVAALILSIHCCKRTYESCYVSIFSDQKMSISHYLVGFLHYIGTFICVIGEAEGFVRGMCP